MPTPEYVQNQLAGLKKQEADLARHQSAERAAAAKLRETATKKAAQAQRTNTAPLPLA